MNTRYNSIHISSSYACESSYFKLTSIQIRWPVTIYCWLLLHERFVSIRNIYSKCHIWPCIKFAHLQNVVSVTTQKSLSLVCKYIRYLRKSLRIHDLEMWWNLLLRKNWKYVIKISLHNVYLLVHSF